MSDLKNRVALVTGGSRGIGRAIALALAAAGAAIAVSYRASGAGGEIAQAVLLLVDNGYMTGQTVAVNGGTLFS